MPDLPWQVVQQHPSLGQQGQEWFHDQQQPLLCQLQQHQALLLLLVPVVLLWLWPLLPSPAPASVDPGTIVGLGHTNTAHCGHWSLCCGLSLLL